MTIQIMIWLRLIVIIWYSFFIVIALVCLPLFFIVGMCTGDFTLSNNNADKAGIDENMKKFLEANSRAFDEKCDADGTCPICLDDFANTKDKQIT